MNTRINSGLILKDGAILPLQVLKSHAGYYIGTLYEEMPYSRESQFYYETYEAAQKALNTGQWLPKT